MEQRQKIRINKSNGFWLVNNKRLNDCFGYEKDFFVSFLKFMNYENDLKITETFLNPKNNFKKHNYQFKKSLL